MALESPSGGAGKGWSWGQADRMGQEQTVAFRRRELGGGYRWEAGGGWVGDRRQMRPGQGGNGEQDER